MIAIQGFCTDPNFTSYFNNNTKIIIRQRTQFVKPHYSNRFLLTIISSHCPHKLTTLSSETSYIHADPVLIELMDPNTCFSLYPQIWNHQNLPHLSCFQIRMRCIRIRIFKTFFFFFFLRVSLKSLCETRTMSTCILHCRDPWIENNLFTSTLNSNLLTD